MDKRYFKCWKCGNVCYTEDGNEPDIICVAPMPIRFSGVCCGSYSIEITKEEFEDKIIKTDTTSK